MSFHAVAQSIVGLVEAADPSAQARCEELMSAFCPRASASFRCFSMSGRATTREFKQADSAVRALRRRSLAEQVVDLIILFGVRRPSCSWASRARPSSSVNGRTKYKVEIVTDAQMQAAGMRAMKIRKFIGAKLLGAPDQDRAQIYGAGRAEGGFDGADRGAVRSSCPDHLPRQLYAQCQEAVSQRHRGADGIYMPAAAPPANHRVSSRCSNRDLQVPVVHASHLPGLGNPPAATCPPDPGRRPGYGLSCWRNCLSTAGRMRGA